MPSSCVGSVIKYLDNPPSSQLSQPAFYFGFETKKWEQQTTIFKFRRRHISRFFRQYYLYKLVQLLINKIIIYLDIVIKFVDAHSVHICI